MEKNKITLDRAIMNLMMIIIIKCAMQNYLHGLSTEHGASDDDQIADGELQRGDDVIREPRACKGFQTK